MIEAPRTLPMGSVKGRIGSFGRRKHYEREYRAVPERGVRWISPPGCPGLFGAHHPGKSDAEAGAGTSLAEEPGCRAQAEARAQQAENKAAEAVADREAFEQTLAESRQAQEKITAALAEAEARWLPFGRRSMTWSQGAESWRRIKDTAGDIEVSAHERAQRIIQSAQDQAAEIRAEGVRWILELQARCQRLKEDLHTSLFSAETELDSVRAAFSQAQEDVEGMQGALADLAAYAQKEPLK